MCDTVPHLSPYILLMTNLVHFTNLRLFKFISCCLFTVQLLISAHHHLSSASLLGVRLLQPVFCTVEIVVFLQGKSNHFTTLFNESKLLSRKHLNLLE